MKPTTEESPQLMAEVASIKEAAQKGDPASEILRRVLGVARKTQCPDMEAWTNHELMGYASAEKTPEYRWVYAKPERHLGNEQFVYCPLDSERPGLVDAICRVNLKLSIPEIEDYLSRGIESLRFPIPPAAMERFSVVDPITHERVELVRAVSGIDLRKIVDIARHKVLEWCIEFEASRKKAPSSGERDEPDTGNEKHLTINFISGTLSNSIVQQSGPGASFNAQSCISDSSELVEQMENFINELSALREKGADTQPLRKKIRDWVRENAVPLGLTGTLLLKILENL